MMMNDAITMRDLTNHQTAIFIKLNTYESVLLKVTLVLLEEEAEFLLLLLQVLLES